MKIRRSISLCALALACATLPLSPVHGAPAIKGDTALRQIAGWDAFVESLRLLPGQLLAKLPPEERDDPQIRAELGRLMLSAVTVSGLAALGGDGDHPAFVPSLGHVINLARPNADTIYKMATITPGGTYRLRGRRGTARLVKIGEGGSAAKASYHDINTLTVDASGHYDVVLSPERPAGHRGDWWPLSLGTTTLMLRIVNDDWGGQEDPTISIERLDRPATRPRAAAADLEARLATLPKAIAGIAGTRMGWISKLREQGYLNKINIMDYPEAGLLAGQIYYESAYDLNDDEALIVETEMPAQCGYRSLILTNEMGETIDWSNNHSSLNASQSHPDTDGVLRIIVSARDPGVPNWLDTAGYAQGGIQGRWTDCSSQPVPTLRKVPFADLHQYLPADTPRVTPAERDRIVRDRRAAFQQRSFW